MGIYRKNVPQYPQKSEKWREKDALWAYMKKICCIPTQLGVYRVLAEVFLYIPMSNLFLPFLRKNWVQRSEKILYTQTSDYTAQGFMEIIS